MLRLNLFLGQRLLSSKSNDFDLQIWDPNKEADTSRAYLRHKHKDSVYNDMSLQGQVFSTFVRGQKVFEIGQISPMPCGSTILRKHSL